MAFSLPSPSSLLKLPINNQRRRVCIIFAVMATVFALCWLPWFMMALLVNMQVHVENLNSFLEWFVPFRYLTCIVNPLLYTFFKPDFRRAFKELLCNKPGYMCRRHFSVPQLIMAWRRSSEGVKAVKRAQSSRIRALPLENHREYGNNTTTLCLVSSV